jgi:MFS family permease
LIPFPATHASTHRSATPPRTLGEIARQPKFLVAVGAAAVGYFVMVMVMTATPISMRCHAQSLGATALVIQWHVLGMSAPSFFTGWLIRRLGVLPLMLAGVGLLLAQVVIALSGFGFSDYVSALTLLGVGWNFLYVGGSALLTETHSASEGSKVQAFNDFTLVGTSACAALLAGAFNDAIGWRGLNLMVVPLLIATAGAIVALSPRRSLNAL